MFKDLTDTHPCMSVITENLSWSSNSSTLVKESSERKVCLRETQRLIYGCTYAVTYVRGLRRSEYFYVRCCVCIAGGGERIASCTFSLKTHRLSLGSQLCQGSLCHCSLRGSWTSSQSTLSLSLSPAQSYSSSKEQLQRRCITHKEQPASLEGLQTAEKVCLLGELQVTHHFFVMVNTVFGNRQWGHG